MHGHEHEHVTAAAIAAIWLALLAVLGVGCRKETASAPPPSTLGASHPAIPARWTTLDLPSSGLLVVSSDTDEHGFYADYRGSDRQALLDEVARRLVAAGYRRSCSAEDGYVLGFSAGDRQLAVKVDQVPVLVLSVFDAQGKEPLLHGLCFGRYRAGPAHILTPEEKEEFARQFDDEPATSPSPGAPGRRSVGPTSKPKQRHP